MSRRLHALHDERGGILIPVLMSVFIMTLLGVALFEVARLGDRLRVDIQTSAQALEIAEAGLERGLHLLYLEFVCGPDPLASNPPITDVNCRKPPTNPNYITDNKLARVALTVACPAAVVPDGAANFQLLKQTQAFAGGTYTVCVRPHPDAPTDPRQIQVRSLGTLNAVTGAVTRIVQSDATAISAGKVLPPFFFSPCTNGCGAGSVSANPVVGNVMFAGSLWAICTTTGCTAFNINNNGGVENNYRDLPTVSPTLNGLIPIRFEDGTNVNTLGASLQVNKGAVLLSANSACIGRQTSGGASPCPGGRDPNGPMAGVFTSGTWGGIAQAGACPPLNGGATINTHCNVWTLAQGSFPAGGTTATPLLSDSVVIDPGGSAKGYLCYFNPPGTTCPNTTDPLPGGTNLPEFFYATSWRIDDTRGDAGCDIIDPIVRQDDDSDPGPARTVAACTKVLTALQTGGVPLPQSDKLVGGVPTPTPWPNVLQIKAAACARLGGANDETVYADPVTGNPRTACTLQLWAGAVAGSIDTDAAGANPAIPARPFAGLRVINVYLKRPAGLAAATPTFMTSSALQVAPCVATTNTCYEGQLALLADNPAGTLAFRITTHLLPKTTLNQAWCDGGAYLAGYSYPCNHFLSLMTTGNVQMDGTGTANMLTTVIAVNTARTAKVTVLLRSVLAGTVIANQLDTSAAAGGQPVTFYQAPWNLNFLPQGSSPVTGALAAVLAANWREVQ